MHDDIQAVIFDCDGTLVDSETSGLDVLHEQAAALGLRQPREAFHAEFRGRRMADCVASIRERSGVRVDGDPAAFDAAFTVQVREAMAQRFRSGIDPLPGAVELLERLHLPFCVATNGPREKAELTLGLTGLLPHLEGRIFCAYEVGSWKPAPGLFLHAARALGVAPEHCAVVEDSLPGIAAGLAAGMRVFSLCPPDLVPPEQAARIVHIDGLPKLASALGLTPPG